MQLKMLKSVVQNVHRASELRLGYAARKIAAGTHHNGGAWNPKSINACQGGEGMAVGVYMHVTHKGVIGLFFDSFTLTDHAVFKFEPLPVDAPCK